MNLNIKFTNVTTSDVRSYVEKKLASLDKLVDLDSPNVQISVEISKGTHHKTGEVYKTDISFNRGGQHIFASAEGYDVTESIDKAKDELTAVIKKGKDRRMSLIKRGANRVKNFLRFNRDDSNPNFGR